MTLLKNSQTVTYWPTSCSNVVNRRISHITLNTSFSWCATYPRFLTVQPIMKFIPAWSNYMSLSVQPLNWWCCGISKISWLNNTILWLASCHVWQPHLSHFDHSLTDWWPLVILILLLIDGCLFFFFYNTASVIDGLLSFSFYCTA